jgi:hypothetical protein
MPASHHPVFKQPSDPGTPIWRYLDFTKFVSMLESSSLFFARSDYSGDPFEGSYSKANLALRPLIYKDFPAEALAKMDSQKSDFAKWIRPWTFVSCWHMNAGESAAMWKLYARTNEAVAVKSSFFRLANELDPKAYIGMVEYIDFERDWLPEGNTFYPFVHKRLSFAHEREVRALIQELPIKEGGIDRQAVPPSGGIERKIDLSKLIESIYVAPTCPHWFRSLTEQVCRRYGLTTQVVQSALDAEPMF